MALGIADFVPSFLLPGKHNASSTENLPVKPLINVKRNASSSSTWYCNRIKNGATNVFCNKNNNSTMAKIITYNGSDNSDATTMIDNSATGNYAKSTSNQSALQDQQTINYLQKTQPNFSLPLQPSQDVKMNVNQQQIEINIKY